MDVQKVGLLLFPDCLEWSASFIDCLVVMWVLGGHVGTIRCHYHPDFNSMLATLCKGAGVMNFELLSGLFRLQ